MSGFKYRWLKACRLGCIALRLADPQTSTACRTCTAGPTHRPVCMLEAFYGRQRREVAWHVVCSHRWAVGLYLDRTAISSLVFRNHAFPPLHRWSYTNIMLLLDVLLERMLNAPVKLLIGREAEAGRRGLCLGQRLDQFDPMSLIAKVADCSSLPSCCADCWI